MESLRQMPNSPGIMIRSPPIVWPIGYARRGLEPGTRPIHIARGLNPDIKIWPFFSRLARLTAFFARTGILKMKLFHRINTMGSFVVKSVERIIRLIKHQHQDCSAL